MTTGAVVQTRPDLSSSLSTCSKNAIFEQVAELFQQGDGCENDKTDWERVHLLFDLPPMEIGPVNNDPTRNATP